MSGDFFYVKNVSLLLRDSKDRQYFAALTEKLRSAGVTVAFEKGLRRTAAGGQMRGEGRIYLTDDIDSAHVLIGRGEAVLGWQHENGECPDGIPYLLQKPEEAEPDYLEQVYRRFHDIPWEIARTKHCLIRETCEEDLDSLYEIYSSPAMTRYMENLFADREQEREYIREYRDTVYRYYEFGVWTVLWKETGEIIGRAGFSIRDGWDLPELGFLIGVPWQGKGIATEVCREILRLGWEEYGFEGVQALVHPDNQASLAVCRRLGFAVQGKAREKGQEYLLLVRKKI